jgi:hypothetical protein
MGRGWQAHDEVLKRDVAVKEVLLPGENVAEGQDWDASDREKLADLAMNEARSTAALNRPGIVAVFDVIEHDDVPMIVMELLKGRRLAEILREKVRLAPLRLPKTPSMLVRQGCRRASRKIVNSPCRLVVGSAVPNRIGTRRHRVTPESGLMRTDRHRPTPSRPLRYDTFGLLIRRLWFESHATNHV